MKVFVGWIFCGLLWREREKVSKKTSKNSEKNTIKHKTIKQKPREQNEKTETEKRKMISQFFQNKKQHFFEMHQKES